MVGENQHCCLPIGPSRLGKGTEGWRGGSHVTKSSREFDNRPPLLQWWAEGERKRERSLDKDQKNPSTTHRLRIVAYSPDSISGHFIIQLGQLSHHTAEKRALQSNWKLHTGTGGHTERDPKSSLHFHYSLALFLSLSSTTPTLLLLPLLFQILWRRKGWREGEEERKKERKAIC